MENTLEQIKHRIETRDLYSRMLGITVEDGGPGYSKVCMPFDEEHFNSVGGLHGGAIMSLADMAFGVAANFGQERVMITSNLSISFMKVAKAGPIVAEGHFVNGGKRVATYEVNIFDGEGEQVALCVACGYRLDVSIDQ